MLLVIFLQIFVIYQNLIYRFCLFLIYSFGIHLNFQITQVLAGPLENSLRAVPRIKDYPRKLIWVQPRPLTGFTYQSQQRLFGNIVLGYHVTGGTEILVKLFGTFSDDCFFFFFNLGIRFKFIQWLSAIYWLDAAIDELRAEVLFIISETGEMRLVKLFLSYNFIGI